MTARWVSIFGLRARVGSLAYRWLMENRRRLHGFIGRHTMYSMFDSIDVSQIPRTAKAAAGYVDGRWPTFFKLRAWCQQAAAAGRLLSIAVFPKDGADALDIENGDATPDQAPAWVKRQLAAGKNRPGVYSSVSEMVRVLKVLEASGINRKDVRVITAHYTGKPHLCSSKCWPGFTGKADATQWRNAKQDPKGRNLDTTLCSRGFFR